LFRCARSLLVAALGIAGLAGDFAAAQTCSGLQAELAHLQSRGGGGGLADRARYETAYREQGNVLARTERRARDAGCFGGGFFFRRDQQPICDTLIPKLRDMQANLWRLDNLRRGQERGAGNQNRIRQLQFIMAARGCHLSDGGTLHAAAPDLESLLGRDQGYFGNGTFRTLCVRTCDGYYFPISFSTTRDRLPEDERTCQALCPGTESKLFFHDNPGGGPENMTALDGQAYSSLSTAFKYRTSLAEACTCRPAGGYAAAATTALPSAEIAPTAPLPKPRPAPGEDPETLANRAGDFVPRAISEEPAATASVTSSADGRPVRIVGPPHWSSPEQEGVVLTPVPN